MSEVSNADEGRRPQRVSNDADVIDSRQVIERIEELRAVELKSVAFPMPHEDYAELLSLENLAEQGADLADWVYGETLIRDSYFADYARELAEDIGALNPDAGWPNNHIDWEAAAEQLQMDYIAIEFDGVTYWGRA